MFSTEILIQYQELTQQCTKRLAGTTHNGPIAHQWGIITNIILDVYRKSVGMKNISFEDLPYQPLMPKIQEVALEEVGDPNVLLELKKKTGTTSAAIYTVKYRRPTRDINRKVSVSCFWCQSRTHAAQMSIEEERNKVDPVENVGRANIRQEMRENAQEEENIIINEIYFYSSTCKTQTETSSKNKQWFVESDASNNYNNQI